MEDVTFEHLPDPSKLDELRIPDGPLGPPRLAVFSLRNHSGAKNFRFRWPTNHPTLSFSPATGHLLAGATKDITLTFKPAGPVKLAGEPLKMAMTQINHVPPKDAPKGAPPPQPVDWDDRSTVLTYPPGGAGDAAPVAKPEPEPSVQDVAGSAKELVLKVWAAADNAKYDCGAPATGEAGAPGAQGAWVLGMPWAAQVLQ